jgi:hypothetical protein
MSRSSKSKTKRSKKQEMAPQPPPPPQQEEEAVVVETTTVETVVETTVTQTTVEEGETTNEQKEEEEVNNKEDDHENEGVENNKEEEASSSKKRNAEEIDDHGDVFDLGKMMGQIVNTVGSFFQHFWGTQPAEPSEGPPSIDQIIPMMMLGDSQGMLESALLEVVTKEGAFKEYKKDLAFETRQGDTTTVHSVRLQLYHGDGLDPEEAWPTPIPSVQTIVLVLPDPSLVEKWICWIRQQYPNDAIVLLLTAEPQESEWHCSGIQSWHFLSSSEANQSPNHVSSVDDLLYSLVEHSLVDGDSKPSAKRRKVDPATVAESQE